MFRETVLCLKNHICALSAFAACPGDAHHLLHPDIKPCSSLVTYTTYHSIEGKEDGTVSPLQFNYGSF